jgi:TatD DNase family protein
MTPLKLIDTHCHIDQIEDLDATLREAIDSGVIGIIAAGTDYESNQKVLEIAQQHRNIVFPALGLHPQELTRMEAFEVNRTLYQIEDNIEEAVAISEIGLDYHKRIRVLASKERQQAILRELLIIAGRHHKPAVIHNRYAWRDAVTLAIDTMVKEAVFHWYTGPSSVLRDIIAQDYFISVTPASEYHSEHRRAVREAPLSNLLLETDSPVEYGRESRYTSKPKDVLRSLNAASEIKGLESKVLAEQTTQNAIRLFRLPVTI